MFLKKQKKFFFLKEKIILIHDDIDLTTTHLSELLKTSQEMQKLAKIWELH